MTAPDACLLLREEAAVALLRGEGLSEPVRAHLATCAPCRADVERLAALPPLLAVVRDEDLPPVERPDDALLHRLLAELARRRRRRRVLAVAAAAVAAVVLALPVGAWVARPDPTPATVLVAAGRAEDPGSSAGASVEVLGRGEGRGSILVVKPWGLPSGVNCRIELVDSAGTPRTLAEWVVPPGYTNGWTSRTPVSVAPREVADVRLVDAESGRVLLLVPVRQV